MYTKREQEFINIWSKIKYRRAFRRRRLKSASDARENFLLFLLSPLYEFDYRTNYRTYEREIVKGKTVYSN